MSLTNLQKLQKINQQSARTRELFEKKFTRADWDAKRPEAIKFFKKCNEIAAGEVWGVGQIDNTFKEVNLSDFKKDNPNIINDLKAKYSIK